MAVTSFSSSLAGKVAVAILFEILRCSCLIGIQCSTFLRCCNVEDLHQAPSATRVWSEAY